MDNTVKTGKCHSFNSKVQRNVSEGKRYSHNSSLPNSRFESRRREDFTNSQQLRSYLKKCKGSSKFSRLEFSCPGFTNNKSNPSGRGKFDENSILSRNTVFSGINKTLNQGILKYPKHETQTSSFKNVDKQISVDISKQFNDQKSSDKIRQDHEGGVVPPCKRAELHACPPMFYDLQEGAEHIMTEGGQGISADDRDALMYKIPPSQLKADHCDPKCCIRHSHKCVHESNPQSNGDLIQSAKNTYMKNDTYVINSENKTFVEDTVCGHNSSNNTYCVRTPAQYERGDNLDKYKDHMYTLQPSRLRKEELLIPEFSCSKNVFLNISNKRNYNGNTVKSPLFEFVCEGDAGQTSKSKPGHKTDSCNGLQPFRLKKEDLQCVGEDGTYNSENFLHQYNEKLCGDLIKSTRNRFLKNKNLIVDYDNKTSNRDGVFRQNSSKNIHVSID